MISLNSSIRLVTIIFALALSGCSILSRATGHHGWESFTFNAELPADTGITVKSNYYPVDPSKCQAKSFATGSYFTRTFGRNYVSGIADQPHQYRAKIPLTYKMGLCAMTLESVDLEIDGRYGPQQWQTSYGRGGLKVVDTLPPGAANFEHNNLNINGECHWLFQQSSAISRTGEIEKMLRCKNAFAFIRQGQLSGKTVNLTIKVNPIEEPSHDETWVEFPNGWKPCAADGNWSWCKKPPTFQTFKLNGKTCSIYPNCTE